MEVFELVRLFVNKTVVSKGLRRPLSNDLCPNRTLNTLINNAVIIARALWSSHGQTVD